MCRWWALILCLWVMAGVAAGSERGVALRAVPEAELQRLGFDAGESSALFVGVSQFSKDETLTPVPYAVDDAVDLAHLFVLELGLVSPGQGRVALALSGEPAKAECWASR